MNDEWKKTQSTTRPSELDTISSHVYNYLRKNIEEKTGTSMDGETYIYYEYDELKIKKEDWWIYEALQENTADIVDNREGLIETYEATEQATSDVADLREAVIEIYEMLTEEG